MTNPWAEHKQSEAIRSIAGSLERIADSIERYADADPMTVLHEAIQGGEWGEAPVGESEQTAPTAPASKPEYVPAHVLANNGHTIIMAHPGGVESAGWHIVLRREPAADSGFVATIERA